ncbi:Hydrolase [Aphelenchoides fujianensis]|nr:Hydrolase [Aphelenchoides fujianensis]
MISLGFLLVLPLVLSGPLKPGGGGSPLDDYTTCQEFSVQTDDGYILTMHRIPYGRGVRTPNPEVVFLQHGLEDSSASWVINLPGNAAGYLLADAGFDVWMGNSRGNAYSLNHAYMDPTSKAFWNFTFDQMVRSSTCRRKSTSSWRKPAGTRCTTLAIHKYALSFRPVLLINAVQGALTMFAKAGRRTGLCQETRISPWAPVATVNHITGGMRIIADLDLIDTYLWIFGDGQFIAEGTIIEKTLEKEICRLTSCPVYLAHMPAGTSTRNVHHWTQMVKSGHFCKYDYGTTGKPVEDYDLTKIKNVPIYLYASDTDWLADPSDVKILRDRLPGFRLDAK